MTSFLIFSDFAFMHQCTRIVSDLCWPVDKFKSYCYYPWETESYSEFSNFRHFSEKLKIMWKGPMTHFLVSSIFLAHFSHSSSYQRIWPWLLDLLHHTPLKNVKIHFFFLTCFSWECGSNSQGYFHRGNSTLPFKCKQINYSTINGVAK